MIHVTVYDFGGGTDTASVQLVIDIPTTSSEVKGSQGGLGSATVIIIVLVVIFVVLIILGFAIANSRSKKKGAQVPPPQQYAVQYPTGPQGQVAPRFQPVQRR